jgi:hypothetical protein
MMVSGNVFRIMNSNTCFSRAAKIVDFYPSVFRVGWKLC